MNSERNIKQKETSFLLQVIFLSGVSSFLLFFAWHSKQTAFLIFFAFVPFYYLLGKTVNTFNNKLIVFIFVFLSLFFWVYYTIYWIKPISPIAHFLISLLSTFLLFIPFIAAFSLVFSGLITKGQSIWVFILLLISIEILHDLGPLGFPYLNTGHVLGHYPELIQWYSAMGSIGGTAWILIVNLGFYYLFRLVINRSQLKYNLYITVSLSVFPFLLPVLVSLYLFYTHEPLSQHHRLNVLAVHTNANVFDYKYEVDPDVLLGDYLDITKPKIEHEEVNYIFWPENALTGDIYVHSLEKSSSIQRIRDELFYTPNNILISGAIIKEKVNPDKGKENLPNIIFDTEAEYYFKRFNSALFIRDGEDIRVKTKGKLVPIGEKVPPNKLFRFFLRLIPNLADLNFSARDDAYVVFQDQTNNVRINTIICYGSAFSTFVAKKSLISRSGFIAVLSNEGWMQSIKPISHFSLFSVCRAIENRQLLVKTSNQGMSAIIDERGVVQDYLTGNEPGVVKGKLSLAEELSFYARYHIYIAFIFLFLSIIYIGSLLFRLKNG